MSVNKKVLYIILLLIFNSFIFSIDEVNAYDVGRNGTSEAGTAYVPIKTIGGAYAYCSQASKDAPITCSSKSTLDSQKSKGINYILNSNLSYICKEWAISQFLYDSSYDPGVGVTNQLTSSNCGADIGTVISQAKTNMNNTNFSINSTSLNFSKIDTGFSASVSYSSSATPTCEITTNNASVSVDSATKRITVTTSSGNSNITLKCSVSNSYTSVDEYYGCDSSYTPKNGFQNLIVPGDPATETIPIEISGSTPSKGEVTLKKVITGTNTLITSGDVTVAMYSNANCSSDMKLNEYNFIGQLSTPLQLEPGTYYFKEIKSPGESYTMDDKCHKVEIDYGDVKELKIENTSECIVDVLNNLLGEGKNFNDKTQRITLYEKYLTKGKNYTNFLDFNASYIIKSDSTNEEKAALTCSQAKCNNPISENYCLNVKSSNRIEDNNWACYTDTITDTNGNKGYCETKFDFNNNDTDIHLTPLSNYFSLGKAKAGQFIFKADKIGSATINQICYFNDASAVAESINMKNYDDFIENVSFNNQILNPNFLTSDTIKLVGLGSGKFTGKVEVDYYMDEVLVEPISGKPCSNNNSCISIGAGLISEFQDGKNNQLNNKNYIIIDGINYPIVPFKINFKNSEFGEDIELDDASERSCIYYVEPEIIKYKNEHQSGELDLEFRAIDTTNPFNRNTNSNWCGDNNCENDNNTVTTYISNRNNSYNNTKEGVLYTNTTTNNVNRIVLTPELVKEIREWNNAHKYDNYELDCDENGNCENAFLKKFKIIKVS